MSRKIEKAGLGVMSSVIMAAGCAEPNAVSLPTATPEVSPSPKTEKDLFNEKFKEIEKKSTITHIWPEGIKAEFRYGAIHLSKIWHVTNIQVNVARNWIGFSQDTETAAVSCLYLDDERLSIAQYEANKSGGFPGIQTTWNQTFLGSDNNFENKHPKIILSSDQSFSEGIASLKEMGVIEFATGSMDTGFVKDRESVQSFIDSLDQTTHQLKFLPKGEKSRYVDEKERLPLEDIQPELLPYKK